MFACLCVFVFVMRINCSFWTGQCASPFLEDSIKYVLQSMPGFRFYWRSTKNERTYVLPFSKCVLVQITDSHAKITAITNNKNNNKKICRRYGRFILFLAISHEVFISFYSRNSKNILLDVIERRKSAKSWNLVGTKSIKIQNDTFASTNDSNERSKRELYRLESIVLFLPLLAILNNFIYHHSNSNLEGISYSLHSVHIFSTIRWPIQTIGLRS